MARNIRDKIGFGLALLVGGFSLANSGCQNMTDADRAALALRTVGLEANTARQAAALDIAADYTQTAGNREHDVNVAQEGRSQLNVNVGARESSINSPEPFQNSDYYPEVFTIENLTKGGNQRYNGTVYQPIIQELRENDETALDLFQIKTYENGKLKSKYKFYPHYYIFVDSETNEKTIFKGDYKGISKEHLEYLQKHNNGFKVMQYNDWKRGEEPSKRFNCNKDFINIHLKRLLDN